MKPLRTLQTRTLQALAPLLGLMLAASASAQAVVSFQPLYDVTQRVAKGGMSVQRVASLGASPHHFDPTPRDVANIRRAKVVVMAGLGADTWLEQYAKSSSSNARVVKLGEEVRFNHLKSGNSTDPHWWLDASIMAKAATHMGEVLAQADPKNAALYRKNAKLETSRLNGLHTSLKLGLQPIRGQKVVTFHNAFGYFARAYGLEVVGTLAPPAETVPTPQQMAKAVRLVERYNLPAIFAEPQLPDRAAQAVARETGAKLYTLDPAGSPAHADYFDMMRYNRDTLLKAFR